MSTKTSIQICGKNWFSILSSYPAIITIVSPIKASFRTHLSPHLINPCFVKYHQPFCLNFSFLMSMTYKSERLRQMAIGEYIRTSKYYTKFPTPGIITLYLKNVNPFFHLSLKYISLAKLQSPWFFHPN